MLHTKAGIEMIPLIIMEHLLWQIRHYLEQFQYHTVCHFHRAHYIHPKKGHKWVQVARVSCRIFAPSSWYRQP